MTSAARKQLERLDERLQEDILGRLDDLAAGPPNLDIEKLGGNQGYRLRVRTFRIVFSVDARNQTFLITRIGDRKNVYR